MDDIKGTIAYKVVGRERRYGSNVTGFEYSHGILPTSLTSILEQHPKLKKIKKYIKKYDKGKIVRASKDTVGILCFDSIQNAKCFIDRTDYLTGSNTIIVKVKGFGRKTGQIMVRCGGLNLFNFLRDDLNCAHFIPTEAYNGVMAFNSVRVLE